MTTTTTGPMPPPGEHQGARGPVRDKGEYLPGHPRRQLRDFWCACGLPAGRWPGAIDLLGRYWRLIEADNDRAGLMGRVGGEDFAFKHVADSLAILPAWPDLLAGPVELADVGCGAGLPGIVLAIALPALRVTAIESNRKKATFVALAAEAIGLSGRVEAVDRRSRELARDDRYRRRFSVVVARAVAPADKLIRDCRGLMAPGGSAVFYKTPAAVASELPLARREAGRHNLTVQASRIVNLPAGAGRRQFLRIDAAGQ